MSLGLLALIASIPLLTILALVVGFRMPTTKAMPIAFVITLCLALFVWKTPLNYIGAAIIKGIGSATEILLIIFGALALLFTLREAGALAAINKGFKSISEDRRVQVILISWFMGASSKALRDSEHRSRCCLRCLSRLVFPRLPPFWFRSLPTPHPFHSAQSVLR